MVIKKIVNLFIALITLAVVFISCTKNEPYEPVPQEILFSDTSGVTGELIVYVLYDNGLGNYPDADGSNVFLYANYDDIVRDLNANSENLAIYRLFTGNNSNSAYFGFINYGNYYVLAYNYINNYYYEKISIVQVRPLQEEQLTITLQNMDL